MRSTFNQSLAQAYMLKNSHALLTIEGLPKMNKATRDRLVEWLRCTANEIAKEDPKIFANPCRFRMMK